MTYRQLFILFSAPALFVSPAASGQDSRPAAAHRDNRESDESPAAIKRDETSAAVAEKCHSESDQRPLRIGYGPGGGKTAPRMVRAESPRAKCVRKAMAAARRARQAF